MNEKTWWSSHVKPRWTQPTKLWLANKVQDAFNAGLPDVDCIFNGAAAKIELKYAKDWPARPETKLTFSKDKPTNLGGTGKYLVLSPGQVRHLVAWARCNGLAYVLVGIGKEWFMYNATLFDGHMNLGMTQQQMRDLACLSGTSYQDLVKVPEYLEELHNGRA